MATLWQQQDGIYMLFYIFNSTVVDWTCFISWYSPTPTFYHPHLVPMKVWEKVYHSISSYRHPRYRHKLWRYIGGWLYVYFSEFVLSVILSTKVIHFDWFRHRCYAFKYSCFHGGTLTAALCNLSGIGLKFDPEDGGRMFLRKVVVHP